MVVRLLDNLIGNKPGVWIVSRPGMRWPFSTHTPCVVVMNAASIQRLQATRKTDARRIRGGVEITRDDGWKFVPMRLT